MNHDHFSSFELGPDDYTSSYSDPNHPESSSTFTANPFFEFECLQYPDLDPETEKSSKIETDLYDFSFDKLAMSPSDSQCQPEESGANRESDVISSSERTLNVKAVKTAKIKPKRIWGEEEEKILFNLATLYKNDWKKIAARIYKLRKVKKSATWLRKRYNLLHKLPGAKRRKFTHEEDLKLVGAINEIGMNWIKIAENFPGREAIMLKNRYYSYIRKYNLLDSLLDELGNVKSPLGNRMSAVSESTENQTGSIELNGESEEMEGDGEEFLDFIRYEVNQEKSFLSSSGFDEEINLPSKGFFE